VEVDLVLQGKPILEYPPEALPTWDYAVSVTRASNSERHEFYVATLQKFLPRFRLPLGKDQQECVVDLQGVFARCYDRGGFNRKIDYGREPPVPLDEENRRWLGGLLRRTQELPARPPPAAITGQTLNSLIHVPGDVASDLAGDLAEKRIEQAISLYNQIKETAYLIWLQEGCPQGRDVEHWHRAIEQLKGELKAWYGKTRSSGNGP
jgi:hypothetical protein